MISWTLSALVAGVAAVWVFQRMFYPYFWDDLIYYLQLRKVRKATMARMRRGVITYLDRFVHQAGSSPGKPFIVFEDRVFPYGDVDGRVNKFANVFRAEADRKRAV